MARQSKSILRTGPPFPPPYTDFPAMLSMGPHPLRLGFCSQVSSCFPFLNQPFSARVPCLPKLLAASWRGFAATGH